MDTQTEAVSAQPGRGRILAIDDEPSALFVMSRTLAREHDVVVSPSVRHALEQIDAQPAFDVILCDLLMPEQTGMELHAALRERHPELASRVVFVTGAALSDSVRGFLERSGSKCLPKPFGIDELRAVVVEQLSAHRAAG